ncbi:MAG: IS481 family transposase [Deltaproteobacteria bacterium]|nr:MAG: IS481 family transposase [Deltaproteobacteria bacterium]
MSDVLHSDIVDNSAMPWKATDVMKEKVNFVLEWEKRWNEAEGGQVEMAELCRKYGVSRAAGYRWVNRFREAGHKLTALEEKSRRPHSNPNAISAEIEDWIVQARKQMPRRGPRKLRAILVDRHPDIDWPSTTSIGNLLKRRGLCRVRKTRKHAPPLTQPFAATLEPNDTWCIDFKGKFRLQDGNWCHVLTLMDADTRFLLRAEAMLDPTGDNVEKVLDSAFQEFGLPKAIRSDNGPPFASTGAGRLTRLSVWWLKLGIQLERIEPGKPQQNGRLERCHLTLEEAVTPSAENLVEQRRVIDEWRRDYNEDRPHEALGDVPPALVYRRSSRGYPRKLLKPDPPAWREACDVDRYGCIRWHRRKLFVTSALAGEIIELDRIGETTWEIRFLDLIIAELDDRKIAQGIVMKRKPQSAEV